MISLYMLYAYVYWQNLDGPNIEHNLTILVFLHFLLPRPAGNETSFLLCVRTTFPEMKAICVNNDQSVCLRGSQGEPISP